MDLYTSSACLADKTGKDSITNGFPHTLRRLREHSGLTQSELASCLRISRSAIGMYESGSRIPNIEGLKVFADFFNVSIDYLIKRSSPYANSIAPPPLQHPLSDDEHALLVAFRHLNSQGKQSLLWIAQNCAAAMVDKHDIAKTK